MIVRADDITPQAWQNGGGRTRELLAGAPDAAAWRWRISLADIASDGPFSAYPGVQRWFAVVEGGGVALDFDGSSVQARVGDAPLAFSGAAAPMCRLLAGPTRDLNLMLRGAQGVLRRSVAGSVWSEAWPLRGHFDSTTRTLEWGLAAGPVSRDGVGLWIGVAA